MWPILIKTSLSYTFFSLTFTKVETPKFWCHLNNIILLKFKNRPINLDHSRLCGLNIYINLCKKYVILNEFFSVKLSIVCCACWFNTLLWDVFGIILTWVLDTMKVFEFPTTHLVIKLLRFCSNLKSLPSPIYHTEKFSCLLGDCVQLIGPNNQSLSLANL